MRKAIIELKLNNMIRENLGYLLDKIESMELIDLIKVDFKEGVKMAIASYTLKEGYNFEDIQLPDNVEMMAIIKKEGNKYICLAKVRFLKELNKLAKKFNLDIVWTTPTLFSNEKMVISAIGDEENLKKLIDAMKLIGEIKNISFKKAVFEENTLLSSLTERQKEILIAAKKHGYYNYPRKLNSKQLSEKIGLSKPTVVEHLRKAEIRLISNLLAGY